MEFDEYVQANYSRLCALSAALTGNRDDAQDLVHTALLKALRHWPRISSLSAAHAYVRRIVVNEFISQHRRAAQAARSEAGPVRHVPDPAELSSERSALLELVDTLPPRQRAAVVLRYYEDLDDPQIAEYLGCSQSTVRSNLSRAMATLRITISQPTNLEKEQTDAH